MIATTLDPDFDFAHKEEIDFLTRQVQRRLTGRLRNFRLLVNGDGLVLRGEAVNFHAKQLAQHIVMKSLRQPILANEIEVAYAGCES